VLVCSSSGQHNQIITGPLPTSAILPGNWRQGHARTQKAPPPVKAVRAVRDAGTTTTLIYRDLENPPSVPSGLVE